MDGWGWMDRGWEMFCLIEDGFSNGVGWIGLDW